MLAVLFGNKLRENSKVTIIDDDFEQISPTSRCANDNNNDVNDTDDRVQGATVDDNRNNNTSTFNILDWGFIENTPSTTSTAPFPSIMTPLQYLPPLTSIPLTSTQSSTSSTTPLLASSLNFAPLSSAATVDLTTAPLPDVQAPHMPSHAVEFSPSSGFLPDMDPINSLLQQIPTSSSSGANNNENDKSTSIIESNSDACICETSLANFSAEPTPAWKQEFMHRDKTPYVSAVGSGESYASPQAALPHHAPYFQSSVSTQGPSFSKSSRGVPYASPAPSPSSPSYASAQVHGRGYASTQTLDDQPPYSVTY